MIRSLICLAVVAAASMLLQTPARAAESYDNCTGFIGSLPATITTQGTWCMNKDLSTSVNSGNAITIAANNVILDCNHFKVGGLSAGAGTTAYGIRSNARLNTTVRNCNVRGFYVGVYITDGGGHLVEDSSMDSNTGWGMYVASPGSTIRNNLVIDTGGSTYSPQSAHGIHVGNGVDVLGNTINGVAPVGTNGSVYGVLANSNGSGSINGNRIRGLAPTGSGPSAGIRSLDSGRGVIRDNDVQGPGGGGVGIYCTSNLATARDNVVAGFLIGIENCLISGNTVNTN